MDYKWIFNINEFKKGNIAIHCKTKEKATQLFYIFLQNYIQTWLDGDTINRSNIYYDYYQKDTCYSYYKDKNGISFGELEHYLEEKYKIYDFSEIDFSQVWDKKYIDNVALDNNSNLNITKAKYITKEQLNKRGYKTGDVLFDGESMAIVYGNKTLHINTNCVETLNPKAFDRILPIELIENNSEIQGLLSGRLSSKISQAYLEDCFIKIEEPPKIKTVCLVKFTADTLATKGFILEDVDSDVKVDDIVECCTSGNAYQYCRVVRIEQLELSEHEINNYRTCRKLSL